jgi:hypothetical protein
MKPLVRKRKRKVKMIQIRQKTFNELFNATLDKLELISEKEGTINVNLNSQFEVDTFIKTLYRRFHYEVAQLKRSLEDG